MEQRSYEITFLTPAFLGGADQGARWRSPPFKQLLRAWWRVAWAQDQDFRLHGDAVKKMRAAEGRLFGNAWLSEDEGGHRKSRLRLRLDSWDPGKLKDWEGTAERKTHHPEVGMGGNGMPVGSELYLGYGPLTHDKNRRCTVLKGNAAIQAGETATLRLAIPGDDQAEIHRIDRAMHWIDRFGTIGGRSRNGWGALQVQVKTGTPSGRSTPLPLVPWEKALETEWAHAVGADDTGPLIWQTGSQADWHGLMQTLAAIKIGFRTHLSFTTGKGAKKTEPRHWLSYPVTNHDVLGWNNQRLPNSMRFTARKDAQGRLRGVIYHMPIRPPAEFRPDGRALCSAWGNVHDFLDTQCHGLNRIKE
ncbi:RAMP superfamily CRISPR-associated protein [Ectothiorhodospira lacustris]|uniref:RAMP superfamily CRISPR-associated protein n=1 Tax=Ectothiorhodospira TaxID=1051 RepID=UPI001EE7B7CF|nr:RAMP superfamily CRISPR-associated protein [Ectothiorhodospira lacustris]MCG5502083.1 hypothetical protein [Ectothiorhodospira lacustris]